MRSEDTRYYVRLEPSDRRYWHWWLARRDRLDVYHQGAWFELLEWKELIAGRRPYPVEVTLSRRGPSTHQRPSRKLAVGRTLPARRATARLAAPRQASRVKPRDLEPGEETDR